jgi:hypothetical protein
VGVYQLDEQIISSPRAYLNLAKGKYFVTCYIGKLVQQNMLELCSGDIPMLVDTPTSCSLPIPGLSQHLHTVKKFI